MTLISLSTFVPITDISEHNTMCRIEMNSDDEQNTDQLVYILFLSCIYDYLSTILYAEVK